MHFNIIFPSMPWSGKCSLPPLKPLCAPLLSPTRTSRPNHEIQLPLINRMMYGEKHKSRTSSLCNVVHRPDTSALLDPNTLLNTQPWPVVFSCDQVTHPYKTSQITIFKWDKRSVFL